MTTAQMDEMDDLANLNREGRRAAAKAAKKAGYEVDVPFELDFEGTSYEGFEIKLLSLDINEMFALARMDVVGRGGQLKLDPEDIEEVEHMFGLLASKIVEWNAVRKGEPVPKTAEGVMSLGMGLAQMILQLWFAGMTQVSAPLAQPSPGGSPSLEASMNTATRSPSQPS